MSNNIDFDNLTDRFFDEDPNMVTVFKLKVGLFYSTTAGDKIPTNHLERGQFNEFLENGLKTLHSLNDSGMLNRYLTDQEKLAIVEHSLLEVADYFYGYLELEELTPIIIFKVKFLAEIWVELVKNNPELNTYRVSEKIDPNLLRKIQNPPNHFEN